MEDEVYGVDKEHAHPNAVKLVTQEFFWDCADDLAPFGSDEGDTGLSEFRSWRLDNPNTPIKECLNWAIEDIAEITQSDYNENILSEALIKEQIENEDFDDAYYIWTVDVTVISTGFGQLLDEGKIDLDAKPIINLALSRQIIWAENLDSWGHREQYISNLSYLKELLNKA